MKELLLEVSAPCPVPTHTDWLQATALLLHQPSCVLLANPPPPGEEPSVRPPPVSSISGVRRNTCSPAVQPFDREVGRAVLVVPLVHRRRDHTRFALLPPP